MPSAGSVVSEVIGMDNVIQVLMKRFAFTVADASRYVRLIIVNRRKLIWIRKPMHV